MKYTIFYSWQSDTDSKYNKTLIKNCITSAMKNIENRGQLKGMFFNNLQESTSNIPGSPSVVSTLEERIDKCHIFIGDLTIANSYPWVLKALKENPNLEYKFAPNSNVYGEYNRAFGNHNTDEIIAVMNAFYGNPKEDEKMVPFDTRQKRFPFLYSCGTENDMEKASSDLITFFENAIRESILAIIKEENYTYLPFLTYTEHNKEFQSKCKYCSNEKLEQYKNKILLEKYDLRILGISGIGKTRLILESVKESEEFIARYLYCDCFEENFNEIKKKIEQIFINKENPLIVLDNCDYDKAVEIKKLKRRHLSSKARIITIWNQDDKNSIQDCIYLNLNTDLNDVIDQIIEQSSINITDENKKLIKEFSDGIPLMAILLTESLNEGNIDIGKLTNKDFVNKLIFEENDEREILKSCSLFRYVGFEDDLRSQIKFIVGNTYITPISGNIEVKMVLFDKLFNKYKKREIIETNGRLFGIRPRPLAFALAEEWFDDCSDERMSFVIQAIQDQANPNRKTLTESLCTQIKYLGDNAKVRFLIEKLTGVNGPFDNAEVVNTELGSRLFRSFAEVNPIAVADNLYRLFGEMDINQLKLIDEGRRNLVWTLEKLCFDKNTFEKGAKVMMSFAVAENENISNNATGQFLQLFRIQLPGTQASLEERTKIIQWGIKRENYLLLSIKAIDSSLDTGRFYYTMGAEIQGTKVLEQYSPKTWDEVFKYWDTILNILMDIINAQNKYSDLAIQVLEKNVRGLCTSNASHIILPKVREVMLLKNNDWDNMLDALYDIKNYDFNKTDVENPKEILSLISTLTKDDFVSRFLEVKKNRNQDFQNYSFDEDLKYRQEKYKELAIEFVEQNLFDVENIKKLVSDKMSYSGPFGITVAEQINDNDKKRNSLLNNFIVAISELKEPDFNPSIILDIARGLNKEGIIILLNLIRKYDNLLFLLFPIYAIREVDLDKVEELFSLVECKKVPISYFINFFNYYPNLSSVPQDKMINVFSKILNLGDGGLELVLRVSHNLLFFKDKTTELGLIKDFVEGIIIEHSLNPQIKDLYYEVISILLNDKNRVKLAKHINLEIIKLAKDLSISFVSDYNIEKIYNLLLEFYFGDIWGDLSNALLSDKEDYMIFFHLQYMLGSRINKIGMCKGLMFYGHTDSIFRWCDENPDKAPERLATLVPIYEGDALHPYAKRLIDKFGNNEKVLSSLSNSMGTFSWTGSIIPLYKKKRKIFESLLNHPIQLVCDWAQKNIGYLDKDIEREKRNEAEEQFLYSD